LNEQNGDGDYGEMGKSEDRERSKGLCISLPLPRSGDGGGPGPGRCPQSSLGSCTGVVDRLIFCGRAILPPSLVMRSTLKDQVHLGSIITHRERREMIKRD